MLPGLEKVPSSMPSPCAMFQVTAWRRKDPGATAKDGGWPGEATETPGAMQRRDRGLWRGARLDEACRCKKESVSRGVSRVGSVPGPTSATPSRRLSRGSPDVLALAASSALLIVPAADLTTTSPTAALCAALLFVPPSFSWSSSIPARLRCSGESRTSSAAGEGDRVAKGAPQFRASFRRLIGDQGARRARAVTT